MDAAQLPQIQAIAVTIEQAAKLIGTNDKQIRRAIYARELPAVRLGKIVQHRSCRSYEVV